MVIVGICTLLAGSGYAKEEDNFMFPSEYPAEWDVIFVPAAPSCSSFWCIPGFPPNHNPETTILGKGSVALPGEMPLPCDIIYDKNVPMTLRDGKIIYTDIFRPAGSPANLPAIIGWSPYGKAVPMPPAPGVPPAWFSGWAKFEGPDAAFWCCNGYAVVNPDVRGAFYSEGNIHYWGEVDAADGYEFVEWVARQDWSSGKVGLHGASWLGIAQWYIAALQPPHLTALAPWAAHFYDMYRGSVGLGGIPDNAFANYITSGLVGLNLVESPGAMIVKDPLMNPYWEDKVANMENIKIPIYSAGPYGIGMAGFDLEGFLAAASKDKWLRVYNVSEWVDLYDPVNEQDLLRFFDHYLKGINNGWEQTPTVRVAVYDPGGVDQLNIPESSWPLAQTEYRRFYLDAATGTLSPQPVMKASSVSYDAKTGEATFTIGFDEDTYVIGYLKLRLWVEAAGNDDMDFFVLVQKLDQNGNLLTDTVNGYTGPDGRMRASLRALDPWLSTYYQPVHSFLENDYLAPGQIVPVDIRIAPTGMLFHTGEQLRVTVAGDALNINPLGLGPALTNNVGDHIIYTGLKYDSYLQLPIIPLN